jgi:integrase
LLPNGKWRARYVKPDGKERAGHFDTKKAGERWCRAETAAIETGQYADPRDGRITFREYAEGWRADAVHRPSTRDRTESLLRLHVYPVLGDRPIGSIRSGAVQSFISAAADVLAPSTLRMAHTVVVAVFAAAVRDRKIPTSPCQGVRLPEASRRKVQPHDLPDLAALNALTAALPERFRAVVPLVAGSGLRPGEVLGLELRHFPAIFEAGPKVRRIPALGGHVQVDQQLVSPSTGRPHLGPPKTRESERTVPLAQVTLDELAAHLAMWPATEVEIEDRADPRAPRRRSARLLFALDNGRPVARNVWSAIWLPAARAAGLPPRTGLHMVRHWYASALIHHGASVKAVQARLGHSSAKVTLDVYSHLWPDDDDQTRDAIAAALGGQDRADSERTETGL